MEREVTTVKSVKISRGAIIGSNDLVNKYIGLNEIRGGVPAKK